MIRTWALPLELDGGASSSDGPGPPLFLRIARALIAEVRRGRLRPGAALPGTRPLAEQLGVHRNTVVAAYDELRAEGWVETRPGGGTFVSAALPEREGRGSTRVRARPAVPQRPGYELHAAPGWQEQPVFPDGTIVMAGGVPDVRLLPVAELSRAYRRALRGPSGRAHLGYGPAEGHPGLRRAIATMVSATRGGGANADAVLVTRGSQMALDLLARAIVAPGDRIAVEALGYPPAWGALRQAGASLVPVPIDDQGLDVAALIEEHGRARLRALYLTPHHHYPTTVALSPGRRLALLEFARRERVAVIEDDYDHEFHYDGRPVLPLASTDAAGVVAYVGTLSKVLAPGLRLGFVVAPPRLVERLAADRFLLDRQGDHALEAAVAELLDDGAVARHVRRVRKVYERRRGALCEALARHVGGALAFRVPAGGMALWATADEGIDVERWSERGRALGVGFVTGRRFAFDGGAVGCLRLGFASLDERELGEAARRLARALRR
jgi:GntR family transcriptional regulator / MocR family aminotransferase